MRLLWCVSDHGFGHATRTIALLREALRLRSGLSVLVQTGPKAAPLFVASFRADPRVAVVVGASDPGLLMEGGSLRVDFEATQQAWTSWAGAWPGWVDWLASETAHAGGCDAVVADVTPPALRLADRLDVPGLLIGNFTWTDLLVGLPSPLRETIRDAQGRARASLCYPFHSPFDGAPTPEPLPLVARRPTRTREAIRRLLGASDEPLIYLSAGQSSSPDELWELAGSVRARLLVPWNAPHVQSGLDAAGAVLRIPGEDPEGQDFIAASDLVLGKVGYGTLSESLSCGVPMVMMLVDGTPETGPLQAGMTEAGAGVALPVGASARHAIAQWLGRGGGPARPWRPERTAEAASLFLARLDALVS